MSSNPILWLDSVAVSFDFGLLIAIRFRGNPCPIFYFTIEMKRDSKEMGIQKFEMGVVDRPIFHVQLLFLIANRYYLRAAS
jgi:hypothetical protein